MTGFFFKIVLYILLLGVVTAALWVVLIGAVPHMQDMKVVYDGIVRFFARLL